MIVHRIVYLSKRNPNLSSGDIAEILESSRRNNQRHDVTGMLIVSSTMFIQLLEGDEENVRKIFATVAQDQRHSDVRVIVDTKAPNRAFPDWTMGFSEQSDEMLREKAKLPGVMSKEEMFDVLNSKPSLATMLLKKLSAHVSE